MGVRVGVKGLFRMKTTAAALLVITSITGQAVEPETLTLACKGTASQINAKPEPISMGIIIDFTARTVAGFSLRAKITAADEATVAFDGSKEDGENTFVIVGRISRVTGDVHADSMMWNNKKDISSATRYSLKCTAAQRMF